MGSATSGGSTRSGRSRRAAAARSDSRSASPPRKPRSRPFGRRTRPSRGVSDAFLDSVRRIGEELAAPNADDVDRNARFPREGVDALKGEKALSAHVPEQLGGGGVSFPAIARACFELGRHCGATAMVFA